MNLSKNHLIIRNRYTLICHPDIECDRAVIGEELAKDLEALPPKSIIAPIIFAPDKTIFFAGGDFLPYTYLPMPHKANQLWIGQVPAVTEVGFIPLYCFLIPNELVEALAPADFYGDNIIDHGEFIMKATQVGAKCFVSPHAHVIYPHAYNPLVGKDEFTKQVSDSLESFSLRWGKYLAAQYRLPVVLHTILSQGGGYNLHAANVADQLFKKRIRTYYMFIGGTNEDEGESDNPFVDDYKTKQPSMRYPQIVIAHGTNNFKNSGDYKIAFTTTEVDGIPGNWVQCLNEMDEIWATSEFARKSFVDSGVVKPVYVIYEGVDPDFLHPGIAPFANPPKETFRFFTNFAWGKRKGVDVLFKAFRKEFSKNEDVCLMVKTLKSYQGHKIKDEIKQLYDRVDSAPIYIYDIEVQKYELGRLYTMANVMLWPSRGEGFGLPPIEALACGLPVIASNHSAHTEFLKKDGKALPGVLLLNGRLEKYEGGDSVYYNGFNWFEPDENHLRRLMREAFNNYKELKAQALESSEYIRREWAWDKTQEAIIRRIEDIYTKEWNKYGDFFAKD